MAGYGKMTRLPLAIRDEACRRLADGAPDHEVRAWLNSLPEVRERTAARFARDTITAANFCRWKARALPQWLKRQEQLAQLRERAQLAVEVARAGKGISEGAAAIIAAQIMEALDGMSDASPQERISAVMRLADAVTKLRVGDAEAERLKIAQARMRQAQEALELARQKFQRETAELFLRWAEDKRAKEILAEPSDHAAKIEALGKLMFGEAWRAGEQGRGESASVHEAASGSS